MHFFIVDDDQAVRSMLGEIIEDEELGEVVGEADDGSCVDSQLLMMKKVDILLIDLLMPIRDGIQIIRDLDSLFTGKIIMISQVEAKEMVGEAYSLGVEYYITKPINRLEVISIIQKVVERLRLQKSIHDIQKTLSGLKFEDGKGKKELPISEKSIVTAGHFLLSELGMVGESGSKDLLDMLKYLSQYEKDKPIQHEFPPLKEIFLNVAIGKLGESANTTELNKEIKASEQRIRRAIFQSLNHLASIGLIDYASSKFENYAVKFFDFTLIRKKMLELQNDIEPSQSPQINTKKFVQVLYLEAKQLTV